MVKKFTTLLDEERKESAKIADAFLAKKKAKGKRTHTDGSALYLHGNKIAWHGENGKVHATMAGWPTVTTRERLNALASRVGGKRFHQKKNKQHYGDQEVGHKDVVDLNEGTIQRVDEVIDDFSLKNKDKEHAVKLPNGKTLKSRWYKNPSSSGKMTSGEVSAMDRAYRRKYGKTAGGQKAPEPKVKAPRTRSAPVTADASRSIRDIAKDISKDWKKPYFGAKPYLEAMHSLEKASDSYGADSGKSVLAYFLANASTYRGPNAKKHKAEIKAHLKEEVDLNEISKALASRYAKFAVNDATDKAWNNGLSAVRKGEAEAKKGWAKEHKRKEGIKTAIDKLSGRARVVAKEETEVDESHKGKYKTVVTKNSRGNISDIVSGKGWSNRKLMKMAKYARYDNNDTATLYTTPNELDPNSLPSKGRNITKNKIMRTKD